MPMSSRKLGLRKMSSRTPAAQGAAGPSLDLPLGFCTAVFGHRLSLTGAKLARLAGMGFDIAEISGLQEQHVNAFDSERIDELAQAARAAKVRIWSFHAAFCGMAMDDADTRRDAVRKSLQAARAARRLGADIVVVHPGRDVPIVNRKREIRWTIEGLAAIADGLPRGMKVALETMGSEYLCGPAEEMLHVMDAPALRGAPVGVCFDSGHVNIGSNPPDYARALAGRIVTVHFHDNHGDKDEHALPGEGNVAWPALLRAIREGGYDGVWMCEASPGGKPVRPFVSEYRRRMKKCCGA
jgi:sugar phosphate isomerase/epimerase